MPETHEQSDDLDPALIYSKADRRWKEIHDAIMAELDSRARGARNSPKGAAGQGKVRGPKR